jgi:hypothetical protein
MGGVEDASDGAGGKGRLEGEVECMACAVPDSQSGTGKTFLANRTEFWEFADLSPWGGKKSFGLIHLKLA